MVGESERQYKCLYMSRMLEVGFDVRRTVGNYALVYKQGGRTLPKQDYINVGLPTHTQCSKKHKASWQRKHNALLYRESTSGSHSHKRCRKGFCERCGRLDCLDRQYFLVGLCGAIPQLYGSISKHSCVATKLAVFPQT